MNEATIIDAKDKKLGRLATEVATILMGKNLPGYKREEKPKAKVEIINASKISLDEKKLKTKKYKTYSGYPGGLKEETLESVSGRLGNKEAIKRAVFGMLPKNKLRSKMIKNLSIKE